MAKFFVIGENNGSQKSPKKNLKKLRHTTYIRDIKTYRMGLHDCVISLN